MERKLCLIYIYFAVLSFSGGGEAAVSRSPGFSEDLDLFLLMDSVYLPKKKHLRHRDLPFIPHGGRCFDPVRVQYFICTAGSCVFVFVRMDCIQPHFPHQFSDYSHLPSSSLSPSPSVTWR